MKRFLLACAMAVVLAGCRRGLAETDRLEAEISSVHELAATGGVEIVNSVSDLRRRIEQIPDESRDRLMSSLENEVLSLRFDEKDLAERIRSIGMFWRLARAVSERSAERGDAAASRFRFRLEALRRFRAELDRSKGDCSVCGPDSAVGRGGMRLSLRGYRAGLDFDFFQAVREGFELGEFARFFNGLPDGEQTAWRSELEKVADRPVKMFDPKNPFARLPEYGGFKMKSNAVDAYEDVVDGRKVKMHPVERRCRNGGGAMK